MNHIITAVNGTKDTLEEEIKTFVSSFPENIRKQAEKAYRAYAAEKFEKAGESCDKLLQEYDHPELWILLGQCRFAAHRWPEAIEIFQKMSEQYPKEPDLRRYLGMSYHGMGDYEHAVEELEKLYPLKEYRPFYYTAYGDSLQMIGKQKQARDIFYEEVNQYEKTGQILSAEMTDGAYQNLLLLDLILGNGLYQQDMDSYRQFLQKINMTPIIQEHLATTVRLLSEFLTTKSYRPLFKEFICHIAEKGYITREPAKGILESGFTALDSFVIHEDRKISALMESFVASLVEAQIDPELFEGQSQLQALTLTYQYYMSRYAFDYPEEVLYLESTYPHTYRKIAHIFKEIYRNPEKVRSECLKKLLKYSYNSTTESMKQSMEEAYQRALKDQKEPAYVYDGDESYRRLQPKIGRNDPCPCGSGKKYKKCCGRG